MTNSYDAEKYMAWWEYFFDEWGDGESQPNDQTKVIHDKPHIILFIEVLPR